MQALLAGNFSDEKKVAASAVKTLSLSEDALQVVSLSVGDLVSEKEVEESLWKAGGKIFDGGFRRCTRC